MAKKRIDKEHDSSTTSKVVKVGAAALAVGVGAASFNRTNLNMRMHKEVLPALTKTTKNISKDIKLSKASGNRTGFEKRLKAKDIRNAFDNNIGLKGEKFKQAMKEEGSKKIKFSASNKKTFANKALNAYQFKNNDLRSAVKGIAKDGFIEENKNKTIFPKFAQDKRNYKEVNSLFHQAYEQIQSNTLGDDISSEYLEGRFNKLNFSKKERTEFLQEVKRIKEHADLSEQSFAINTNLENQVTERIQEKLLSQKRSSETRYAQFDKFIKDKIGFEISSENLLKGSRAATVKDFKDNKELFDLSRMKINVFSDKNQSKRNINFEDLLNEFDGLDIDDMILDKSIRVKTNGEMYSTRAFNKMQRDMFNEFSSSTLGKIFGMVDVRQSLDAPNYKILRAGKTAIESVYEQGNNSTIMQRSKIFIDGDLFDIQGDPILANQLKLSEEAVASGHLLNVKHGKASRLYEEMIGTNDFTITASDNELAKIFDLRQTGAPDIFRRSKAFFEKGSNEDWEKNVFTRLKSVYTDERSMMQKVSELSESYIAQGYTEQEAMAKSASRIFEDHKVLTNSLNSYTSMHKINDQTIANLLESGVISKDSKSERILNILLNKDYENASDMIRQITTDVHGEDIKLYNKDLKNLSTKNLSNEDYFESILNIAQVKSKSIFGATMENTNIMNPEEIVRREAVKEVILQELYPEGTISPGAVKKLENIIQNSNLNYEEQTNLRYLSNWGILQQSTLLQNDMDADNILTSFISKTGTLTKFDDSIKGTESFKNSFVDMLDDLGSRHGIFDSGEIGNINEKYYNEYNDYAFLKRSSILDILSNINDPIKALGSVPKVGKELLAGRNDLGNYTTLSAMGQFMVARLSWGVEEFGLGLSKNSTESTLDYIKNIGLKRVLPAMAIYSLYDYANYESENITGVSITGAAANALHNVDMGFRRFSDETGLSKGLDWAKESSVWGEYWTGSTDFQTYEEREDWYKNGYTAVRSGRLWGFGSTSEFRGSGIQYYQPNYLRRAHSNWQEVGIYGSAEEKFKHSLLPSLRHPLSTFRYLADPYWLEKKNMDERPYPLTGKMFSEGSVWGAVLNPTLGELIKPVRMLPEVRKRLGNDGRDIKEVLSGINERIKNRGNKKDDLLVVKGTDIKNAYYVPYSNPGDDSFNFNISNGQVHTQGLDFMNMTNDFRTFRAPTGDVLEYNDLGMDQQGEFIQEMASNTSNNTKRFTNDVLTNINNFIKDTALAKENSAYNQSVKPNSDQGVLVYRNLVNMRNRYNDDFYAQKDYQMISSGLATDYLKDGAHSVKQLSGIYNFLGDLAFGEQSYTYKWADAGQVTSFSRGFWDANIGGVGGGFMEIARRFFPSEDRSRISLNPLKNTMPEWLPERFLSGDAYASLPKGEMRMPGKGYETIHDLHPDQFGDYGAFDRMKILADIAPTSEEYKIWRSIAKNTVHDPNLVKQIEEIEERAEKMSSKHDFYNYRYVNNNVTNKKGVVKSINGSTVTLGDGQILNLAGLKLTEEADIFQFLQVGDHINYRVTEDAVRKLEDGIATNAVIYKKGIGAGAVNINKELISSGMAEKDKKDKSALGYLASASSMQQTMGAVQELIGHANIPLIHNKLLKIETARESFEKEHIYGTSFATWDNPIRGFVAPLLNDTAKQSTARHALALGSTWLYLSGEKFLNKHNEKYLKYGAGVLNAALNPSALLGMGVGAISKLGITSTKSGFTNIELGAGIGTAIGTVSWGLANIENPLKATTSFAAAGMAITKYLDFESVTGTKGAAIGAMVGLGLSALKNPNFSKDMLQKWIPKETRKKYEIDEYFDRMEYIKYKGLYNQAALRSFIFEGNINIKKQFKKIDKNREEIAKLTKKAEKLSNKYSIGSYSYNQELEQINKKIFALESQQTTFTGGKNTQAAIAYKKAMDSTVYGLKEGATKDEILASVPDQYKDHFKAFMDETNKKERKKILKTLPDYLKRPLQVAWGEKPDRVKSNLSYFNDHKLPGMAWRGWKPNINLKHVKMKTIQNEGMLLSDFGYYESEKSKASYHMAEGIQDYDKKEVGGLSHIANLTSILTGMGMSVQNISVKPSSAPGLMIVGDVKQAINDGAKISDYAVHSGAQALTSLLF